MHLPLYPQSTGIEIQVIPLEGADFASAQAGGQFQQEQFIASILSGLNEKPLDLLRGQYLHFSALGRGQFAPIRRVAGNEVFLHCLF